MSAESTQYELAEPPQDHGDTHCQASPTVAGAAQDQRSGCVGSLIRGAAGAPCVLRLLDLSMMSPALLSSSAENTCGRAKC
jgi:hypothetical protein